MTATRDALRTSRTASAVSDVLGPLPVAIALCLAGAHDGRSTPVSIGWGLLALSLLAVVPYIVTKRARHPKDGARPSSGAKGLYMAVVAGTALLGFAVLILADAPQTLLAVALAVVVALVATAAATAAFGLSNHTSACSGGVAMCVVVGGPLWLPLAACVIAVGIARVALGRHSVMQAAAGAVLGVVVSCVVLAPLV